MINSVQAKINIIPRHPKRNNSSNKHCKPPPETSACGNLYVSSSTPTKAASPEIDEQDGDDNNSILEHIHKNPTVVVATGLERNMLFFFNTMNMAVSQETLKLKVRLIPIIHPLMC